MLRRSIALCAWNKTVTGASPAMVADPALRPGRGLPRVSDHP